MIVAASVVAYPDSLAAIAGGAAERAAVQGATPWTLVATIFGEPVPIVVIALQLVLVLACIQGARLAPPALRMHAVLALTLIADLALVPYVQDHDQLLLAPALFLAVRYGDLAGSGRRGYIALVSLAFVLAPWLIQVPTVVAYTPSFAGAVPFLAGATVLAGTAIARGRSRRAGEIGTPPGPAIAATPDRRS
jgi:hypothetical protein